MLPSFSAQHRRHTFSFAEVVHGDIARTEQYVCALAVSLDWCEEWPHEV